MAAKKEKMGFSVKFAIFCLMLAAGVFFPVTVLLCGCMLPTFVAALVDNNRQKTAGMTVGAMNLAGTIPAALQLIQAGATLDNALALLLDPKTLMIAYIAGLVGWIMYYQVPPLVAQMLARRSERRLKQIEKQHLELVRKWGPAVTGEVEHPPAKQP